MMQFIFRKTLRSFAVLMVVMLLTFLLMHAIPGNPWSNYSTSARMLLGADVDKILQSQISHHFGLDLPLWRQFTRYMIGDLDADGSFFCGAICGNLGPSIRQRGRSVQHVLFSPPEGKTFWQSRFGYSIQLVFIAALLAAGLGILLGILGGMKPGSGFSRAVSFGLAALISIPNFVLGLLAILLLASWLKIIKVLPDWNIPSSWIIPAVVLALMPMAHIARVTSASIINIRGEDYIRTARAKGAKESRVILKHMMRNALAPILTFLGPTLMEMFTGLLIVENLYSFPGFGQEYWRSVLELDYPMIMGVTLIYSIGILLVNLLVESLNLLLDPRLRAGVHEGAQS